MSSRNRSRRRNTLRRRAIGAGDIPIAKWAGAPPGAPAGAPVLVLPPRAPREYLPPNNLPPVAAQGAQAQAQAQANGVPFVQLPRQGGRKSRHRSRRHRSRRHRSRGRK